MRKYKSGVKELGSEAEKVLEKARKRYAQALEYWSEKRERQADDLRFLAGDPDNKWQWPDQLVAQREQDPDAPRPCLTINQLTQHVNQVVNDHRMNRPGLKARPADDYGDVKTAEIIDDMLRQIQSTSDADTAYDQACYNMVGCGEGWFRVLSRYIDGGEMPGFKQELVVEPIRNSMRVLIDPQTQHPTARDAKWMFILSEMLEEEFEDQWPRKEKVNWDDSDLALWHTRLNGRVYVTVAEYFYFKNVDRDYYLLDTGEVVGEEGVTPESGKSPIDKRTVPEKQLCWVKMSGSDVLDFAELPGKWFPLIRALGVETEVDGKVDIKGLVRPAKDAQRSYNYWSSVLVEKLALQSKAPVVGYAGQFEGFEDRWSTSNIRNFAYLEVNPITDGQNQVLPLPQRMPPPADLSAIVQSMMLASDDLKRVTGQYNASLGQQSNEVSGRAISARQKEGDTGTYHFLDNMKKAITQLGRVLIDLIPAYYDVPQMLRVLGEDGKPRNVRIDPTQPQAMRQMSVGDAVETIFNPGVGRYDVIATIGPSFDSRRQESLTFMSEMTKANPALWQVIGDLMVKAQDWPGADKMAERLKMTLLPPIQQMESQGANLPPDVQAHIAAAQQQIQQQQQMMQEQGQQLAQIQQQAIGEKQQAEIARRDLEIARERLKGEERALMLSKQLLDTRTGEQVAKFDGETQKALQAIKDLLDQHEGELLDKIAPESDGEGEKEGPDATAVTGAVLESHGKVMQTVDAMIKALQASAEQKKKIVITTPSGDQYTGEVN